MDWPSSQRHRAGSGGGARFEPTQSLSESDRQGQQFGQSLPSSLNRQQSTQQYDSSAQVLADPFVLQQDLLPQYDPSQQASSYAAEPQQEASFAPAQSGTGDADRFGGQFTTAIDPPVERQARNYVFGQAWRPCTNSRSLADFLASLRAPYSFRSLTERWQWLGEPQLDTDVGVYPLQADDARPTIRGTLSAHRLNPNLITLSRYQERSFELDLAACVAGDLNAYTIKPLMHFSFHASLYSAFHAELLAREQGLDHHQQKRIRDATLQGFVNDFDVDRRGCNTVAQHLCLLRLMWGEAIDCSADVLKTHCNVIVENLHLPAGDNARSGSGRVRGASGSSTSSNRLPYGMPGYPQSPAMLIQQQPSDMGTKRESGLPMLAQMPARGSMSSDSQGRQWGEFRSPPQSFDPTEGFAGSSQQFTPSQITLPRLSSSSYPNFDQASFEADINSQLRAQYSPSSLYSNVSSSPSSMRSMTGDYAAAQSQAGAMRQGFSTSPRNIRGGLSMPYGMPIATQTILATSSRRILQNRQKSKRHYNRKKLQRSLLADVLIVFGQVFHMIRQVSILDAIGDQGQQSTTGSTLPASPAESRFGVGVATCLSQRLTPPAELSNVVGTATEAIFSQDRGSGGETSTSGAQHSDLAADWAESLVSGSSTAPPATTSAGIPVDLAMPPALAAAGAAATMPALSALSTNERKRLSKMMQRHLEVQRMQQVSSMARHLLSWMQQTGAHRMSPSVSGESVFTDREGGTASTGSNSGDNYEPGSAAGGLNMATLRHAVQSLSSDPELAATFAFVQAWRSFRASWQDLVQAEARLSNRSQRPVSQLVEAIDRRAEESADANLREQQRYTRVAASILGMQQGSASGYGDDQQQRSGMSSASHGSQVGDPSYASGGFTAPQGRDWP